MFHSGDAEPVYNLRVADYHSYFVGAEEWRFTVWAHNACDLSAIKGIEKVEMTSAGLRSAKFGSGTVYLIFDTTTGQLLKIGSTAQPNTIARLGRYIAQASAESRTLELHALNIAKADRSLETFMRSVLGKIYEMPWDKTGGRLKFW